MFLPPPLTSSPPFLPVLANEDPCWKVRDPHLHMKGCGTSLIGTQSFRDTRPIFLMPSCQAEPYITAENSPLPGPEGVHVVPPDPGSAWLFCVTLGRTGHF